MNNKQNTRKHNIIYLTVLFSCIITILMTTVLYGLRFRSLAKQEITINKNATIKNIGEILQRNGVIWDKTLFYLAYRMKTMLHDKRSVKYGQYMFEKGMSQPEVLEMLLRGSVHLCKITIIEGKTSQEIYKTFTETNNLLKSEVAIMPSEGSLLPETYKYSSNTSIYTIIERAQNAQKHFLEKAWSSRNKEVDKYIKNKQEAVILASIVEKESSDNTERKLIAGVFLNRLAKRIPLQSDPTVIYGINKGKDFRHKLSIADLKHKSSYNTYVRYGLPQGAICHPSKNAILSVLNPTFSDNIYFVYNAKIKKHVFSKTFSQHVFNINERTL